MSSKGAYQRQDAPDLGERLQGYLRPISLILLGMYYFAITWLASPLLIITHFEKFRHKAFARLWAGYGQAMSEEMPPGTVELVALANGLVLDVGPGTGTQMHLFTPSKITKIYGAEPAVDMHAGLLESARKHMLGDKYEALAAGAETESLIPALAKRDLLRPAEKSGHGVFDTIVSLRALCGVPQQEETVATLYRLLKPGGKLIICEHVKQPYPRGGDFIAAVLQNLYMLAGWSFWLGGCCLNRDTEGVLRAVAGPDGWRSVKIDRLQQYAAVPYIVGELIKA